MKKHTSLQPWDANMYLVSSCGSYFQHFVRRRNVNSSRHNIMYSLELSHYVNVCDCFHSHKYPSSVFIVIL